MQIASIAAEVKVHTWPEGQLLHTYKSDGANSMSSVSWSKDGSWLVLVPDKGHAEVISVKENLKHLHCVQEIQQPSCAVFENSTKRNVALGSATGLVVTYDIKSRCVKKLFPKAPSTVFRIEYCVDDSFLIAACANGEILLYNNITNNTSSMYKIPSARTVSNVRFHRNKKNIFAAGSKEGVLAVWDIYGTKLKYSNAAAHSAPITDVTFTPLHGDLVVSTGFDRKLMFFEMSSNKCVIEEVLENSPTCVDFCPDGKGLAVALQNGTVQTYDIRQMSSPLHAFAAHNGQIKQLRFQKSAPGVDRSNSFNFSEGKAEIKRTEANESNLSCSSFSPVFKSEVLLTDSPAAVQPSPEIKASETMDSFMDALGINLNFSDDNSDRVDSKINVPHIQLTPCETNQDNTSQLYNKILLKNILPQLKNSFDNIKAQSCSTPKDDSEQQRLMTSSITSPIVADEENNSTAGLTQTNFPTVVREEINDVKEELRAIREQIKEVDETLKEDIKFKYMNSMSFTRQHFLDLQMYLVKEFIKVEYFFDDVKQSGVPEESSDVDFLIQENMKLRQEIQELRRETQELRSQLSNKNA